VRVRQGTDNDLTVKVRVSDSLQVDTSRLREHFPCEIDRTGAGENTSYSVRRKYKTLHVPEMDTATRPSALFVYYTYTQQTPKVAESVAGYSGAEALR
jgi:hypothetical protein